MTQPPAPMYTPEPRLPEQSSSGGIRMLVPLLLVAIAIGTLGAVASVMSARNSGARQQDVIENQRLLVGICEQIRDIASTVPGESPQACPSPQ